MPYSGKIVSPGNTTYYIDGMRGDDANPGTSPEKAWRTTAPVNAAKFAPGDRILFAGGQVFRGPVPEKPSEMIDLGGRWLFRRGDARGWEDPALDEKGWENVVLPDTWKRHSDYDGENSFGWYRRTIEIPESFRGHALILPLGRIDDCDVAYFNGTEIGRTGKLPPDYEGAWRTDRRYRVSPELVRYGGKNTIAVRVYNGTKDAGIYAGLGEIEVEGMEKVHRPWPTAVVLDAEDGGSATGWIEVSSYGGGRATIDGGKVDAISANGASFMRISNLALVGEGRKTGNRWARGIVLDNARHIEVADIDAGGFQKAGISGLKCEDVRIERCHAHDNGFAGIWIMGRNIYIGHCRAINNPGDPTIMDNHSGNGILVSGEDALIEYCESARNGWDQPRGGQGNGPVGIWCHDSKRVTIQFCISHNNDSTSGDGGGYDLDGGAQDSLIQYCYSYENKSSGWLLWEYGSEQELTRNVIRYCISANDGESGLRMGTSVKRGPTRLEFHNNVVYNDRAPCVWMQTGGQADINIRNNVLIGPKASDLIRGPQEGVTLEDNCYWTVDGKPGQEKLDGKVSGVNADPKLSDPAKYTKLTDPDALATLKEFTLRPDSPLRNAGLDLKGFFGVKPSTRDFFGNPIAEGKPRSVGVHESH